jgi:HEAT repeat protein
VSFDALIADLKSTDWTGSRRPRRASESREAALAAADDRDWRRRRAAVPALIDALHARNHDIRAAAAHALWEIRDPRGFEPLLELLDRLRRSYVREAVVDVPGQWGDPRAKDVLGRRASRDDRLGAAATAALLRIRQAGE